ncbi:MAG TPA: cyclic 2,3-diphosphoglycerate synthase [Actinomycetota bacterium]|nr:cyclic 2,3-diphosphoglycerate synthase [Actinomycetota bacterium]
MTRRVLIMGAAGRDFHNFNVVYRDDPQSEVVAFTATQIPFISDRGYPAELAGPRYPDGIPIYDESELTSLIDKLEVDDVAFSYSDVSHEYVMHKASEVLAAGANFVLLGPKDTMLDAEVPVVAICAVRTGCGKSQTTRYLAELLRRRGLRVVAVRHPMPYGDLVAERVQRFETLADLDRAGVTIEEREEYEAHVNAGTIVYAGVDYAAILEQAQRECDVLLWDGGNNDLPFYRPDLHITVTDPLRAGHERTYHPGEANLRMADVVLINKVGMANADQISEIEASVCELNPSATILRADSVVRLDRPEVVSGKAVLVVEDGPTLTHGGMKFGAGVVAARQAGASVIVDPRPYVTGTIAEAFERYDVGPVLPAEGYSSGQLGELEQAITATPCDAVVIGTPMDLRHVIRLTKPVARVTYELQELDGSRLDDAIDGVVPRSQPVALA